MINKKNLFKSNFKLQNLILFINYKQLQVKDKEIIKEFDRQ